MYDFDWDGTTLAIGDDEGLSLVLNADPSNEQAGVNPPGLLAAITDFVNFGVFNGNFRLGPPNPSQNIDGTGSITGSNFMPGWRFTRSSNSNIDAKHVRDASSPSGSNLRFAFASGLSNDAAIVEQIIDIGGSRTRQTGDFIRGTGVTVSGSGVALRTMTQYLTVDGSIDGMPAEKVSDAFGAGVLRSEVAAADSPPPGTARYLRVRVQAYRTSGTGAAVIDLTEVRRSRGFSRYPILDESPAPASQSIPYIGNSDGVPYVVSPKASDPATGYMALGFKLVPLEFSLLNIAAGVTTQLQPSDFALGLGTPRVRIPWPGHIVGMSYRLSTAITAGTLNIQATVAGANVWSPFGALNSASSQHDATSQPIGTDLYTTSDALGVQVVTNGAFLPTTMDIHAVLWIAVEWDGV